MDIVRVESSLSDGSYILEPDAAEEAQQEEVVHALITEDLTDFANPPQQGKHRSITQFSKFCIYLWFLLCLCIYV